MNRKRILLIVVIIFILFITYGVLNSPSQSEKTAEITREATSSGQEHPVR